ncbi:unnamed protein product [Brassica oleracea]
MAMEQLCYRVRGRSTHLWNESHAKRLEPSRGVRGRLQFWHKYGPRPELTKTRTATRLRQVGR